MARLSQEQRDAELIELQRRVGNEITSFTLGDKFARENELPAGYLTQQFCEGALFVLKDMQQTLQTIITGKLPEPAQKPEPQPITGRENDTERSE